MPVYSQGTLQASEWLGCFTACNKQSKYVKLLALQMLHSVTGHAHGLVRELTGSGGLFQPTRVCCPAFLTTYLCPYTLQGPYTRACMLNSVERHSGKLRTVT